MCRPPSTSIGPPVVSTTVDDFLTCFYYTRQRLEKVKRDTNGHQPRVYLYLESPCSPHGYVLDVPAICKAAHVEGIRVIIDATVGTPFLYRPLKCADPEERPDFVIHS